MFVAVSVIAGTLAALQEGIKGDILALLKTSC
jgi:hypothetical protein